MTPDSFLPSQQLFPRGEHRRTLTTGVLSAGEQLLADRKDVLPRAGQLLTRAQAVLAGAQAVLAGTQAVLARAQGVLAGAQGVLAGRKPVLPGGILKKSSPENTGITALPGEAHHIVRVFPSVPIKSPPRCVDELSGGDAGQGKKRAKKSEEKVSG